MKDELTKPSFGKTILLVFALIVTDNALVMASHTPDASHMLTIHLPRNITIEQSDVTLGRISIIHGADALEELARPIRLGQLFTPDQQLAFTREQILSRLTCNGLHQSQIRLTGAKRIEVNRSAACIKGTEIVALAQQYLNQRLGAQHQVVMEAIRHPKDLLLGHAGKQLQLVPQAVGRGSLTQVRIRVVALVDGIEQGAREVLFRLQYRHRVAVATQALPAGLTLTPAHLEIETQLKSHPEPAQWQAPAGLITQRAIPAGVVIQDGWISRPVIAVTIKRNETVVIRIQKPGLSITAMGRALADAHTGEMLKVKNIDSNRIILCRVQDDGTVNPLL